MLDFQGIILDCEMLVPNLIAVHYIKGLLWDKLPLSSMEVTLGQICQGKMTAVQSEFLQSFHYCSPPQNLRPTVVT